MHTAMIYPTSHNTAKERLSVNRPDGIAELPSQTLAGAASKVPFTFLRLSQDAQRSN
jgi:hypothetical protein